MLRNGRREWGMRQRTIVLPPAAAATRLSAARDELAKCEEQWLELEMKREMLEG